MTTQTRLLRIGALLALGACGRGASGGSGAGGGGAGPDGGALSCAAPDAVHAATLEGFVATLGHSDAFATLDDGQLNVVRAATHALAGGDPAAARAKASAVGYELVPLSTTLHCYWLLRPTAAAPPGQATLVFDPAGVRDLVIEAPHVPNDFRTDAEAAKVAEATGVRALIVAGAQRCGVATPSGCHKSTQCNANGVAVESDPSHSVRTAFHAMHLALAAGVGTTVALQLHTNVYPMVNGAILVSNGTRHPIAGTAADALYAALHDPAFDVRSCNDPMKPVGSGAFCGETNTQSLASNEAGDICLGNPVSSGPPALHRFVHVEQDSSQLVAIDAWSARIAAAVEAAIPASH